MAVSANKRSVSIGVLVGIFIGFAFCGLGMSGHKNCRPIDLRQNAVQVGSNAEIFPVQLPAFLSPVKGLNEVALARAQGKEVVVIPHPVLMQAHSLIDQRANEGGVQNEWADSSMFSPRTLDYEENADLTRGGVVWVRQLKKAILPHASVHVHVEIRFSLSESGPLLYHARYVGHLGDGEGLFYHGDTQAPGLMQLVLPPSPTMSLPGNSVLRFEPSIRPFSGGLLPGIPSRFEWPHFSSP